ncbi:hypothetical protein [Sutcliffiella sp. BMC8]
MLTFLVGPIGLALGLVGKHYFLAILNFIMTFSFFWIMAIGYYFLGP